MALFSQSTPQTHQSDWLTRMFPVPRFLEMPAVGVDISDQSVRFLELLPTKHGLEVGKFGDRPIPPGVIKNGGIVDEEKLTAILKKIKTDYSFEFIRASLPEERVYLFKTEVPNATVLQTETAVAAQLEENVPLPPNEVIFDYDPIKTETGHPDKIHVSVSVIPEKIVKSYLTLFKNAGLEPLSFEIEAQAIARSVVGVRDFGTYMIVDFGKTRTGLSIKSQGVIRYTSTLDLGGESLNIALQKTLSVSPEEAEQIKREKGLSKTAENKAVFDALISPISVLRDELNKHYIYWQSAKDKGGISEEKIQKILLCGGDANLIGLVDYLTSTIRVPVEVANVWTNVLSFDQKVPPIQFSDSLRYATAIGLALRAS